MINKHIMETKNMVGCDRSSVINFNDFIKNYETDKIYYFFINDKPKLTVPFKIVNIIKNEFNH